MSNKQELDVRHLECPMSLIRVRLHLNTMQQQERVRVLTQGNAMRADLERLLEQLHQPLIDRGCSQDGDWWLIEKG